MILFPKLQRFRFPNSRNPLRTKSSLSFVAKLGCVKEKENKAKTIQKPKCVFWNPEEERA